MASGTNRTPSGQPEIFATIVPADGTVLSGFQWLRVTVAGNLVLRGKNGTTETIAVTVGEYVPFGAGEVMAATTATVVGFA